MKASRLLIAGVAVAMLPLTGAFAQSPTPDQSTPPSQKGATFESLDTDSDGRISKTEAMADKNVSEQFARYDQNGNGYIERDEVGATNSSPPPADPKK